jgi:predicted nucleic acid-binding protein
VEQEDLIIADTGFWLALANRRDRLHEPAKRALDKVREPLITTWPVMTETCHLLASRLSVDAELRFIERAKAGAFEVFAIELRHLSRIHPLMEKYRDLPMDLADASLVLLAEELGSGKILSTDTRDFNTYRWKNRKPFRNLLADALQ